MSYNNNYKNHGVMRGSIIIRIIILTVFSTLLSWSVLAAEQPFQQRPLSIAMGTVTYPYQYLNDQGEPEGLMIDLWRLWAKKQQVAIEFVPLPWQQTLERVAAGEIDIHAGMTSNEERKDLFDFSSAFFPITYYLYLHQELSDVESLESLTPYTIGTVKNGGQAYLLETLYPQLKYREYENRLALYNAALNNEIKVFSGVDITSRKLNRSDMLGSLFPIHNRISLASQPYVAAVAKGNDDLVRFIEQGMAKIRPEEKTEIERHWLGLEKERQDLLLAFSTKLPPYMGISPLGKPQGFFIDLWRLWSKTTGVQIDFVADEMLAAVELIKNNQADVHIAFPESNVANTGLLPAWKLYQVDSKVYVSNQFPEITTLEQFGGKSIGVFKTAPYIAQLAKEYPDIVIKYYRGHSAMLKAAEQGEIQGMVSAEDNMNYYLQQSNLLSSFHILPQPVFYAEIFSLVSPQNDALTDLIQQGFERISQKDLIALEQRWFPDKSQPYFQRQLEQVPLSQREQTWLEKKQSVSVGMVKKWAPMEIVNADGSFSGINKDIFDLIGERTGLRINYRAFDDWQSLFSALQKRQVDLAGGSSPTAERLDMFNFSEPYWEMPWVIVHQRRLGEQTNIEYFNRKKLAIVKGYQIAEKIEQNYPLIELIRVNDTHEGLTFVQQGIVAGLIEPLPTASELLKNESLVEIMVSVIDDQQVRKNASHIIMRNDWPELQSVISKGILSLTQEDRDRIYGKWFNLEVHTGFEKSLVVKIAVQVAIFVLLIIIVIVIWNRRLSTEIKRRKSLEQQMKHMAMHDELTGLANRVLMKERLNQLIAIHQRNKAKMAVMFLDLDGFKGVNDVHGHDVGDELLKLVAERLEACVRKSDTVVRFGGDEFVIILTGLNDAKEATFVADKVLKALKKPFELSRVTAAVGASIGIAVYPKDGDSDTELVKVADSLMYEVKAQGKNNYTFSR